LEEIYREYENLDRYVPPPLFAVDVQKQDTVDVSPPLNDVEHETRSQPDHILLQRDGDNEHDQAVYFYDPVTGREVGFTAMNHLLNPPKREPQIHHDESDVHEELEVEEINNEDRYAELEDSTPYFDGHQPDSLNPALYENVGRDDNEVLNAVSIPYDMQAMMYSNYRQPPLGSQSIYREPPELRGPMRRPGWKALEDTLVQIAEVMTPPAYFARFSLSKVQMPDFAPDAGALFNSDVWRNDISIELSFPVSETQRTQTP